VVELRDATLADAHGIATVNVRSWRAAYRGLLPDDVLAGLSVHDREQFWSGPRTTRPANTRIVVATIEDAIVGFAATGPPLVPDDFAPPVGADAGGDHDCLGYDAAVQSGFAVGRVEENVRKRCSANDRSRNAPTS
jgi:hypothetical protein